MPHRIPKTLNPHALTDTSRILAVSVQLFTRLNIVSPGILSEPRSALFVFLQARNPLNDLKPAYCCIGLLSFATDDKLHYCRIGLRICRDAQQLHTRYVFTCAQKVIVSWAPGQEVFNPCLRICLGISKDIEGECR
ncbi:hypothetical protein KC19_3G131700 [Ceratodon purpureus]|uniref:Uncharacterized protein n=1 Tax=Ceratodon purpureus TaxID=3225 RepID=A0A8T0IK94_CERPU|nr:hypothetical protein KC19_3G131700 [Ceratodon purpureus]